MNTDDSNGGDEEEQQPKPKIKSKLKAGWDTLTTQLLLDTIRGLYGDKLDDQTISIPDAMDEFFNIDSREIYRAKVIEAFNIQGDHWLSVVTRSINTGSRHLRKGQEVLLRVDKRDNGKVDVQIKLQDETDQIFSLTAGQWNVIKNKIVVTYQAILTGKEATRARHLKLYHTEFVAKYLGCGFEYRTATGLFRPNYKGTKI